MAALISPQPLAVGETSQHHIKTDPKDFVKQTYANSLIADQSTSSKLDLNPIIIDHGEHVIQFTMEEVNSFTREEGLHKAVVLKFSYGRPDLSEVRKIFSSQFDVQGNCIVGQLEFRHLLIRFDLFNDYVHCLSKSTGYLKSKGDDYFFRTFPWTFGFNPKEETSMAVVWISLPGLPPNLFAKRSLMSIASAVGKPLAVDKATQDRTRPSAARVKVIIDLLDKHPKKVKLQILDRGLGKSVEFYQEIVYDNLPKYCTYCKHQGHDEKTCRIKKHKLATEVVLEEKLDSDLVGNKVVDFEKLQGDARDFLNAKRTDQGNKDLQDKDGSKVVVDQIESVAQTVMVTDGSKNVAVLSHSHPIVKDSEGDVVDVILDATHGESIDLQEKDGLKDVDGRIDSVAQTVMVTDGTKNEFVLSHSHPIVKDREGVMSRSAVVDFVSDATHRASTDLNIEEVTNLDGVQHRRDMLLNEIDNAVLLHKSHSDFIGKTPVNVLTGKMLDVVNLELTNATRIPAADIEHQLLEQQNQIQNTVNVVQLTMQSPNNASNCTGQKPSAQITNNMSSLTEVELEASIKNVNSNAIQAVQSEADQFCPNICDDLLLNKSEQQDSEVVNSCTASYAASVHNGEVIQSEGDQQGNEAGRSQLSQARQIIKDAGEINEKENWTSISNKNRKPVSKTQQQSELKCTDVPTYHNSFAALGNANEENEKMAMNASSDLNNSSQTNNCSKFPAPRGQTVTKDTLDKMMANVPKFNQSGASLNHSFESTEEQQQYGQTEISFGSNKAVIQANMRRMVISSKLWKDQREYDDDEGWGIGFAGFSTEEDDLGTDQDSAEEDFVQQSIGRPTAAKQKLFNRRTSAATTANPTRKLNHNAPVFLPTKNAKATSSIHTHPVNLSADKNNAGRSKTGQNRLVTTETASISEERNLVDGASQPLVSIHTSEQQQEDERHRVTNNPLFSSEERHLLDALINTDALPLDNSGSSRANKNGNKSQKQMQNNAISANVQAETTLLFQGDFQDMPNPVLTSRHIYEEGEEEDILQKCWENASKNGDLSPLHSGKSINSRARNRSGDDKVIEGDLIRRPQ